MNLVIFSVEDPSTWQEKYSICLCSAFPKEYAAFKRGYQYAFSEISSENFKTTSKCFWASFSAIKAFHGCKVFDESTYCKNGIEPLSYTRSLKVIQKLLATNTAGFGKSVVTNQIETTIENFKDQIIEQRVFLTIDSRHFQQRGATDYTHKGSEFVRRCLYALIEREKADHILQNEGQQCIIHCEIPLNTLNDNTLDSIFFNILDSYIEISSLGYSAPSYRDLTISPKHVARSQINQFDYNT